MVVKNTEGNYAVLNTEIPPTKFVRKSVPAPSGTERFRLASVPDGFVQTQRPVVKAIRPEGHSFDPKIEEVPQHVVSSPSIRIRLKVPGTKREREGQEVSEERPLREDEVLKRARIEEEGKAVLKRARTEAEENLVQ
jgi:hypothetical protein